MSNPAPSETCPANSAPANSAPANSAPANSAPDGTANDGTANDGAANGPKLHTGGCHCGAVRYQVRIDTSQGGRCNCSICNKTSQLGSSVKPDAFRLLAGQDSITDYVWGHEIGRRSFCKHCGVHCFGAGHLVELGGDFVSINFNTLDDVDPLDVKVIYWDGRHDNWQAGPRDQPWRI